MQTSGSVSAGGIKSPAGRFYLSNLSDRGPHDAVTLEQAALGVAGCRVGGRYVGYWQTTIFTVPVAADASARTAAPQAAAPVEIELVQTPGQFETKGLRLKPGNYVFKIVNRGIGHEVGFYL